MAQMQKVFTIRNKKTEEIEVFGTDAGSVINAWNEYYKGSDDEQDYELFQTFMSVEEIKKQMN